MPGGSQEMIDDGCLNGVTKFMVHIYGVVTVLEQYIQDLVLLWHHQMNSQLQSKVKVVMVLNHMKPLILSLLWLSLSKCAKDHI